MNSKAFYRQANLLHACVQDIMNSVCVAMVVSTVALLLSLKTEWLVAGMGNDLLVTLYNEWTSDGFWSFVGLYSAKQRVPLKHCAHYARTKKKVIEGFVKHNPRQQEPG
jgi:hypothetical protein